MTFASCLYATNDDKGGAVIMISSTVHPLTSVHKSRIAPSKSTLAACSMSGVVKRTKELVDGSPPIQPLPLGMTTHDCLTPEARFSSTMFSMLFSRRDTFSCDSCPSWIKQ